ncbi:MAG: lactate racemase domain-containing protein [Desulfitobacteriaceae bacterium]|nr:lactate racemase domain-containing protein [Desulfitobacteriaceae bacterium]MDI6913593.1 lactate racemase domain-containing protein [Desulfitobacteriaceae bacterium]
MDFPRLYKVRQKLNDAKIQDVSGEVLSQLRQSEIENKVRAGQSVAIAVGSRGISEIDTIVKTVVHWIRDKQAEPFIVPAMGSHGNATAEGQADLLRGYGIYETNVGAPVVSSMDVDFLGDTSSGIPVYLDHQAFTADAIILINRIKPHTTLTGPIQSGLMKLMTVGLGKQRGAESMHRHQLAVAVPEAARLIMKRAPIAFGLAIVENAFHQTYKIKAVPVERIEAEEKLLLQEAVKNLPVIPLDPLDVLVVDWMGKNISGSGMDTNIVGLWRRNGGPVDKLIQRIAVLGLTEESHGNAAGVGMADAITKRIYENIDLPTTYMNSRTAGFLAGAKIPMVLETDQEAVRAVLEGFDPNTVRLVRIKNTLSLEYFFISEGLLDEASRLEGLEILGQAEMKFNNDGRIEEEAVIT